MATRYDIAILGATGIVGEALFDILAQRKFPVGKIYALASERSAGNTVMFQKKPILVEDAAQFDFSKVQLAFFAVDNKISATYAPIAAQAGCVVIDKSSQFRLDPDVPLVVPEVNPEAIADYRNKNIIAVPNCSTIQMVVALKPIYDAVGIERVNVATYQSVSGSGRDGVDELVHQVADLLNGHKAECKVYPQQIAFNLLPHIDVFLENGYCKEEMKLVWETQKIFNNPEIFINPTTVRVPVFYGHAEALHIETREKIDADYARDLLKAAPGIIVIDNLKKALYPTPVESLPDEDAVFVGRIREDISHPRGLNMWVVADNVRKGAALNAIQIAELLIKDYF